MVERSELIALLTAYDPADSDERGYRHAMLDLAVVAHDPFDRHAYDDGHFTASGFVVHPAGDRVLLIHHAKIGSWLQPGGHIDPGDESVMAAAQREISEETGVTSLAHVTAGLIDIDIHVFPARADQPRHRHYDLRFAFVASDDALTGNAEVLDARWVSVHELTALGVDQSVMRPVRKLLGDLSSGA